MSVIELKGLRFPKDYFYEPSHAWLRVEEDGSVTIGIDDFGQKAAGEIVFIDLPDVGTRVKQFEPFARIESIKWVGEIISPISGRILQVNEKLLRDPGLINADPYGKGWMIRVRPDDLERELRSLIHGDGSITKWAKRDIEATLELSLPP